MRVCISVLVLKMFIWSLSGCEMGQQHYEQCWQLRGEGACSAHMLTMNVKNYRKNLISNETSFTPHCLKIMLRMVRKKVNVEAHIVFSTQGHIIPSRFLSSRSLPFHSPPELIQEDTKILHFSKRDASSEHEQVEERVECPGYSTK